MKTQDLKGHRMDDTTANLPQFGTTTGQLVDMLDSVDEIVAETTAALRDA